MVRMKCWKRFCAAALALSLPVMALAEAKLEDAQTFARSITLGRASDTYVTREDWRDTLRAMDGTALSESYADISAQEKGLYYEVANENGVNQTGLMDAAGTLLIPMAYSDFTYVGNGWVVAVTLEETTDEKSDYRAMFGGGHYNVVRGDIYYGAQKMAEMNREETTGASMEVYGAYLSVRLDKSSGFYLKTDGTRTEFTGESFSRGEYEEIYKQGVYHHPTAQFAFVPECTLTADEVSRSVWYDAKTGNFLDLQGNVLREAVQDGKPLYDSVRYYGGDYMLTKKNRLSGIVDMTGQEIISPMYDTLGGDYAGLLFEGGAGRRQAALPDAGRAGERVCGLRAEGKRLEGSCQQRPDDLCGDEWQNQRLYGDARRTAHPVRGSRAGTSRTGAAGGEAGRFVGLHRDGWRGRRAVCDEVRAGDFLRWTLCCGQHGGWVSAFHHFVWGITEADFACPPCRMKEKMRRVPLATCKRRCLCGRIRRSVA